MKSFLSYMFRLLVAIIRRKPNNMKVIILVITIFMSLKGLVLGVNIEAKQLKPISINSKILS
jgi:hypothetical protein